jgi:type IV pilus assembly protein PilY1
MVFRSSLTKERVVRDITIRDGKAIVITVVPNTTDPCIAGGESLVHEIDACNGGRLEEAQFDANEDQEINDEDMVTFIEPITNEEIIEPPSGIQYSSMLYEPVILTDRPVEIKYFGSASGRIETLWELPAQRGFSS